MKRRNKGEGTIRKRSDKRWEGRYTDSLGNTQYIYGKTKESVREKLLELTYIRNFTPMNEISGDVPLSIWYEHYLDIKRFQVKERSLNQIRLHIETIEKKSKPKRRALTPREIGLLLDAAYENDYNS